MTADHPATEPRTLSGATIMLDDDALTDLYADGAVVTIADLDLRPIRLVLRAEAASPAALDVRRVIEYISGELRHYDLSDDPGYIKVPTERVRAILRARLTEQEERHDR